EALMPNLHKLPDSEVLPWLKENMGTQYHPCSTCRMGADDMSVVDGEGQVHGTEALRVIDASVMPQITSGNLHAPTMMLAEKLVDAVRGRSPLPRERVPYADQKLSPLVSA